MNIFWICNIIFPDIQEELGISKGYGGGWMTSLANSIANVEDIKLHIISPYNGNEYKEILKDNIMHFIVPKSELLTRCESIFKDYNVDLIHIHGTESGYGNLIVDAFPEKKYVVSIQGLVSVISEHYFSGLPYNVIIKKTFRDFVKNTNIKKEKENFELKGIKEKNLIKKVSHIIGRTTWDRACINEINPKANYYYCGESLREVFYNNQWNINKCNKYSMFISQGYYPIKGLHMTLKALPSIVREFPDTHLYIGGLDITKRKTFRDKLKMSYYGKYITKLIYANGLSKHVTFLGPLSEEEMCKRFLSTHVFVNGSSIENSPNSLGEAMILGVPSIASDVGGVQDMMTHKVDGYIYPFDEYYMISHYVKEIFKDDNLAVTFSQNAQNHATKTHNRINNLNNLINIYKNIVG